MNGRRILTGRVTGLLGLACYNWWVAALWPGGLLPGPNAFFSDLEANGRRHGALLSHLDVLAGVLLLAALALRGPRGRDGARVEWPWLCAFAVGGGIGGLVPYTCSEGLSRTCRSAEWQLRLGWQQYAHIVVGICEFAAVTTAIFLACRDRRDGVDPVARTFRVLRIVVIVGYPLLGAAYLTDHLGALIEPVFFLCFSAAVLVELFEGTSEPPGFGEQAPTAPSTTPSTTPSTEPGSAPSAPRDPGA